MSVRVALHGALDLANFGDVLLGKIFAEWVREAGAIPTCPGAAPAVAAELGTAAGTYRDADALLFIGGGYFGEPPGKPSMRWRWGYSMLRNHLQPAVGAWLRRRPWAIVGVGAGPVSNLAARAVLLSALGGAHALCVRDDESAAYLRAYGLRRELKVSADAALTIARRPLSDTATRAQANLSGKAAGRPIVAVHITRAPGGADVEVLWQCLRSWLEGRNIHVALVLDQANSAAAQRTVSEYAARTSGLPHASIHPYADVETTIGILASASLVITSKLHVGIVSAALSTPVLAVPYHSKTERFYRQLGTPERCLGRGEWNEPSIRRLLEEGSKLIGTRPSLPEPLLRSADENRLLVDGFVRALRAGHAPARQAA